MRVLCIAGSPRRGGNSDRLLDALTEGVEGAGGIVQRIVAAEAGVDPCTGCESCVATGSCVISDGMDSVYAALDAADAIAVASPVYFATVPAQLKAIYDRCQPYWSEYRVSRREGAARRPGAMLFVRGGGDPYGFSAAEATTRSVFAVMGIDVIGDVEVEGVDARTDIDRFDAKIQRARVLGELLVAAVVSPGNDEGI